MPKYIDVEELKKYDFNKIFDYEASYETCLGIEAVLMIAEMMPSAEVQEAKRGTWEMNNEMMTCSNCCEQFDKIFKYDYLYCPHCGARMDGDAK